MFGGRKISPKTSETTETNSFCQINPTWMQNLRSPKFLVKRSLAAAGGLYYKTKYSRDVDATKTGEVIYKPSLVIYDCCSFVIETKESE